VVGLRANFLSTAGGSIANTAAIGPSKGTNLAFVSDTDSMEDFEFVAARPGREDEEGLTGTAPTECCLMSCRALVGFKPLQTGPR